MKKILFFMAILIIGGLFAGVASADIPFQTKTKFYFKQNNQDFTKPVDFTITCYGYQSWPGSEWFGKDRPAGGYTPESVYSFNGTCPDYGCEINENYHLNYVHIDYCSMIGKADGKDFSIDNYGDSPIDFDNCDDNAASQANCTATFNIPAAAAPTPSPAPAPTPNPTPTPTPTPNPEPKKDATTTTATDNNKQNKTSSLNPIPVNDSGIVRTAEGSSGSKGFFSRIWSKITCFFKSLFGKAC